MLSPLSLITTPIELHKGDQLLSCGTGFYYLSQWDNANLVFLVTNYHVLTMNGPNDRNLKPQGDSVVFYYHMDAKDPSVVVGLKFPIFTKSKKQIWIEHSNKMVDIALIPIPFSLPVAPEWKVVDKNLMEIDLDISPSDTVTLIGYPRMYLDEKNALPIYKTGNIASEYSYDFNGEPCFIIDISAFEGNSGSPVFSIQKNAQIISDRIIIKAPGSTIKFLGVYSAGIIDSDFFLPIREIRQNKQLGIITNLDMQLGVVWRASLIEEIIKQNSYQGYEKVGKELVEGKEFKFKISRGLKIWGYEASK